MKELIIPKGYQSNFDLLETQRLIKEIKDFFERSLAKNLNLTRVSAPMFVKRSSGLNDNLTGIEKPVSFQIRESDNEKETVEVVHSLAKWKRFALKNYNFPLGKGIYTDMNAIRAFELLDNTHSVYVDQWDWEKVISKNDRNLNYLKNTVLKIYDSFLELDQFLKSKYKNYKSFLKEEIFFITSQDLEDRFPDFSPEEREFMITKDKGSVFIMQIGGPLKSGLKHDERSPDYDDWDLNGDILIWNPILNSPLELSSMGIRVSPDSLEKQLRISNSLDRKELDYHSLLLDEKLPYTIGGGIGQSRICMLFLQKAHIGEVQASVWPDKMRRICKENNIILL